MTQTRRRLMPVVLAVLSTALLAVASSGGALAAAGQDHDDATLVGTWREVITFPGVPVPGFDVVVFNEDGTVTERFASAVDGPSLSTSIGVWKKVGHRTFAATYENFSDSDHNGLWDVRFRIRSTYHVEDRNTVTATVTIDTLSIDGTTVVGPPFPGITVAGTRMRVMPE